MAPLLTLAVAAVPAFIASATEFGEAFTIVLAVGNTRGWRSPIWATLAAIATLGLVVLLLGAPLMAYYDQIGPYLRLAVGTLLLLFGMRWLRKALLRFAGCVPHHDHARTYERKVLDLRARADAVNRWDHAGFVVAYKAVLLEGSEVAFIVLTLGAQGPAALTASVAGALAAFALVVAIGALLRQPLTHVPQNWMKFVVGAMLVTFGTYWSAEGLGVEWTLEMGTLPLLFAGVTTTSLIAVRLLGRRQRMLQSAVEPAVPEVVKK